MSESCGNCKFWLKTGEQKNLLGETMLTGGCRRHAPIPLLVPIPQHADNKVKIIGKQQPQLEMIYDIQQVQPTTPDTYWCGDYHVK